MNSSAVLFSLCLILISYSPLATNARVLLQQGLVDQICGEILQDKTNCLNILTEADPSIVQAKDFVELSNAILNLALNKSIDGQNFLKGLAELENSPSIKQCANFDYDGVVGSFRSALNELKDDPQTANYDSKVASDGPACCDRGLAAENITNPAISVLNQNIMLLSNIAFKATNKLFVE